MLKFFFRLAFLGLGLFTTYTFGRETFEPIWHRITGTRVEGRISGFLAGRNSPSVQREPDGVRKGKRRTRRPVFVYPTAPAALDSLEGRSGSRAFFTFSNYELNERVSVVFAKNNPANAHMLGWQLIGSSLLVTLLGLYMIRIGVLGKLD
jgi:hypothetical protein